MATCCSDKRQATSSLVSLSPLCISFVRSFAGVVIKFQHLFVFWPLSYSRSQCQRAGLSASNLLCGGCWKVCIISSVRPILFSATYRARAPNLQSGAPLERIFERNFLTLDFVAQCAMRLLIPSQSQFIHHLLHQLLLRRELPLP